MNDRISELDRRDNRRWLIGVGISIAFGLFGVVMALLSYSHRTASPAGATPGAQRAEGNRTGGRTPTTEPADHERRPRNRQK